MGIYKKIFQTITGKKDKSPKKSSKMKKAKELKPKKLKPKKERKPIFKKLSPEQKAKALELFKKASGEIIKFQGGKPKVIVKPADQKKQPASNFWNDEIDLKLFKATGKQLVIGGTAAALIGGIAYKQLSK